MSRRDFIYTLSATGAALSLGACSADGGSAIRFGYIADYNGASLLAIADKQGLWKKHDLTVEPKVFVNGPVQIQALGTGNLDYGYIGPGALWQPASGKATIVAINTLAYADRVIARPGINSMRDLKGKKVGVPEGTSGEMVLNLALQQAGMTMKDISKVAMDAPTIVSAFASGQIDGAGIWYPLIDTIKEKVPKMKEVASTEDMHDHIFPTVFVSAAKGKAERDRKVMKVLQEANDWRAAHPKESIALTAKLLKADEAKVAADAAHVKTMTTAELVAKTKDGTVDKWLDGMSDVFVRTGQLKKSPDPSTFYAGDLYTKAAAR
ncbi:aliphatic sulfonates family ABC transporter,periplasmic ligand-binding protein [Streptomyces iranensis]|uniref:Aliphatic sulfonates family ABC transporter,periplasmic ligand-binding protein n=2 Tax=Streptomyces iranensis TaxID=576784 RepID=A0A061A297_9ACTN|nr:NitT/TauT family transport system substrate-binding protein [Streptomyces iranensis]CDR16540.1 aliphatic sulfonates family ABC transporter,periplasmic ligand-binding protein [Streptomyces iranensis]